METNALEFKGYRKSEHAEILTVQKQNGYRVTCEWKRIYLFPMEYSKYFSNTNLTVILTSLW